MGLPVDLPNQTQAGAWEAAWTSPGLVWILVVVVNGRPLSVLVTWHVVMGASPSPIGRSLRG